LGIILKPKVDEYYLTRTKRREKQKEVCKEALSRMENEERNFAHIEAGRGYNSKEHKRAVEQVSFECLGSAVEILKAVRKFSKSARLLGEQIEAKNAAGVLRLMREMKPRLERFTGD
jgi:hypothetical protein